LLPAEVLETRSRRVLAHKLSPRRPARLGPPVGDRQAQ
jgi:hypothetical protein